MIYTFTWSLWDTVWWMCTTWDDQILVFTRLLLSLVHNSMHQVSASVRKQGRKMRKKPATVNLTSTSTRSYEIHLLPGPSPLHSVKKTSDLQVFSFQKWNWGTVLLSGFRITLVRSGFTCSARRIKIIRPRTVRMGPRAPGWVDSRVFSAVQMEVTGFCQWYCWWFRNPKQPPGMYKTL